MRQEKMGWSCGTCGGEETCIQGFDGGNLKGREHLEDPGIDGKMIKIDLK
jgi:hypothetical protein